MIVNQVLTCFTILGFAARITRLLSMRTTRVWSHKRNYAIMSLFSNPKEKQRNQPELENNHLEF